MSNLNQGFGLAQEFPQYNFEAREITNCIIKLHSLIQGIKLANNGEELEKLRDQIDVGLSDIDHSVRIIKSWFQVLNLSETSDRREASVVRPKIKKLINLFESLRRHVLCVRCELLRENDDMGLEIESKKEKMVSEMEMRLIEVHQLLVDLKVEDMKLRSRKRSRRPWLWIGPLMLIFMLVLTGFVVVFIHGSRWSALKKKGKGFFQMTDNNRARHARVA